MATFKWLHISDWHQRTSDTDRDIVANELIKDVQRTIYPNEEISEVDVIIFSGDIAFAGKEIEYARADNNLINPLRDALGKKVPIFFVPGNHDIDRDVVTKITQEQKKTESLDPVNRKSDVKWMLAERTDFHTYRRPLEEFYKFAARHGQKFSKYGLHSFMPVPLRQRPSDGRQVKVALIGINSAWSSARYKLEGLFDGSQIDVWDYGLLRTTEDQIREAIEEAEADGCDFNVIVMHHPIYWLHESDQALFEDHVSSKAHILLHGHEHRPRVNTTTGAVKGERRHRDVRRALVESQRRYLNRAYERGARNLSIKLNHAFESIGDEIFIRAKIRYEYELYRGADRKFEFRLGPNNATGQHLDPRVRETAFRILQIKVNDRILNIGNAQQVKITKPDPNGSKSATDESEHFIRYELSIPTEPVTVQYYYEILETVNGVWYFLANRFADHLTFEFNTPSPGSRSPTMKYELVPIGDLAPIMEPVTGRWEFDTFKLTFPDQGYLIHWYPLRPNRKKKSTKGSAAVRATRSVADEATAQLIDHT
jgi:predicted phosphodiesterase